LEFGLRPFLILWFVNPHVIRWFFTASLPVILFGVSVWIASLVLSFVQWRRRGGGWILLGIESLRMLAVTLLCAALFTPEAVREIPHAEAPRVVILSDASGSMKTQDVTLDDKTVVTRAAWLRRVQDARFWKPLEAIGKVVTEDFSQPRPAPPKGPAPEDGTDIDAALEKVLQRDENLKAVLLLSDGGWNMGVSPVTAAMKFRARNVPIYTVGIGSETPLPDLVLEHVPTPAYGLLGEQISIPFKIRSSLPREVKSTVSLYTPDGVAAGKQVTIPAFGEVQDSLVWSPAEADAYDLSLKLPVEPDEALAGNNEQTFRISIRTETLQVLVVDSVPRWEYRYLRNALARDPGVNVECLLLGPGMAPGSGRDYIPAFPSSKELLSKFDVVFLGDIGLGSGELTSRDLELLRGLVEQQGSGLVLVPGLQGRELTLASSPIGDLLPVDFDESKPHGDGGPIESHFVLTSAGSAHLLTMLAPDEVTNAAVWRSLPGFYWSAAITKSRPGSEVLAVHSSLRVESGREPLLVTRPYGNGKVLYLGTDGAWRWRRGVEDKYHYRFWGQVVRWMAHQRHLAQGERIRLSFSPEDPRTGDTVFLLATVFDASGFPIEKGSVAARIRAPSGATERVEFVPSPGGWGGFKGSFEPREGGNYKINVINESGGQQLDTQILVSHPVLEKIGDPANLSIMRELAEITLGVSGGTRDLDSIVRQISLLPEPKPMEKRWRLWSEWWTGAAVVFLLAAYWTARKVAGMI